MAKTGRPRLPKGEAKASTISLRLTKEERARLAATVGEANVSEWIRSKVLDEKPNVYIGGGVRLETSVMMTMREWELLRGVVEILKPKG